MTYLTKCPDCGGREFAVTESYVYDADMDEQGVLVCGSPSAGGVDFVVCVNCHEDYTPDNFLRIDF